MDVNEEEGPKKGSGVNGAKITGINGKSGRGRFRPQAAFLQQIMQFVGSSLASDSPVILAPFGSGVNL